jgi:hypothetical protein
MVEYLNIGTVKRGIVIEATLQVNRGGRQSLAEQRLGQHTFLCPDIGHNRSFQMLIKPFLQKGT